MSELSVRYLVMTKPTRTRDIQTTYACGEVAASGARPFLGARSSTSTNPARMETKTIRISDPGAWKWGPRVNHGAVIQQRRTD